MDSSAATPLDFGELWDRTNPKAISDELLTKLIHDAEVESGDGDGPDEYLLSAGTYSEGVLQALYELKERRGR